MREKLISWISSQDSLGSSQVSVRDTHGSCSGLFEILPGLLQDLNEKPERSEHIEYRSLDFQFMNRTAYPPDCAVQSTIT